MLSDLVSSIRTGRRAIVLTAVFAAIVACAPPIRLGPALSRASVVPASTGIVDRATSSEPITVVARYYSFSPTVSIVAWDGEEAPYGLRAVVRRDGTLVAEEHQFYVSTYYFPDYRAFARGNWHAFTRSMELSRPLRFAGVFRDIHQCEGVSVCSPYETFNARIPDEFLRAGHDSLVVRLYSRNGREEIFTLHRDMIDAYLEKVASVSEALRKH
jgi:hypothetical protein